MSRLGINTGNNPNDGQGDSLRVAMGKINANFLEIYNSFGNGVSLVSYANTSGISTISRNLTGNPIINVGGIINSGISSVETIQTNNLTVSGIVTAIQFKGDGSQLTNVSATNPGVQIYDENIYRGVADELNFGSNITVGVPDINGRVTISVPSTVFVTGIASLSTYAEVAGIATYAITSGISTYSTTSGIASYSSSSGISTTSTYATRSGLSTYASISGISTISGYATTSGISTYAVSSGFSTVSGYATTSGIATVAQGLTGTPNISVGQVGISSYLNVLGVTSFYNNVHFEYDRYVFIGNNDELQLFHNGANSYIGNSSTNNLIIRTDGGSIVIAKTGPENMGVFNTDGSVELYYNNSIKFETTSIGATIFGTLQSQQLNISGITTSTGGFVGNLTGTATTSITATTSGYATTAGISTTSQGLTGTPDISIGIVTSLITIPVQLRTRSVAEKTTLVAGNTVGLAFSTGGGNVAICTSPTGDITLNVTGIPTDSTFDNHSISFSVVVNQTGTARTCTTVNLNGVSRTIRWAGGSLANAISGVTTSTGFDIFTFTGINTVGSASTTSNYIVLGSVNGGFN